MACDSSQLPNMHCKVIDGSSLLGHSEVPGPESSVPVPKVSLSLGQLPKGLCAQAGCAAESLGAGRTVFGAALTVVPRKAPQGGGTCRVLQQPAEGQWVAWGRCASFKNVYQL